MFNLEIPVSKPEGICDELLIFELTHIPKIKKKTQPNNCFMNEQMSK